MDLEQYNSAYYWAKNLPFSQYHLYIHITAWLSLFHLDVYNYLSTHFYSGKSEVQASLYQSSDPKCGAHSCLVIYLLSDIHFLYSSPLPSNTGFPPPNWRGEASELPNRHHLCVLRKY
uniref:Uncharacterized protein n=1 Tax=Sphaerodactylus townsendi TaxID=933632 RepID=A0ACB8EIU7_9SAUR